MTRGYCGVLFLDPERGLHIISQYVPQDAIVVSIFFSIALYMVFSLHRGNPIWSLNYSYAYCRGP